MFWFEVRFPTQDMIRLSERVQAQPVEVLRRIEDIVLPEVQAVVQERLGTAPPLPHYPLRWLSGAQRRAVMAKLRRAKNLPYKRTDRLISHWRVMMTAGTMSVAYELGSHASGRAFKAGLGETKAFRQSGGATSISLTSTTPWTPYVQGRQQQPFHRDTGWQNIDDVQDEVVRRAWPLIVQAWREGTQTM